MMNSGGFIHRLIGGGGNNEEDRSIGDNILSTRLPYDVHSVTDLSTDANSFDSVVIITHEPNNLTKYQQLDAIANIVQDYVNSVSWIH